MPRYALKIEYHGGPFAGWQRQSQGLASVQGAVEAALAKLEPRDHTIAAAGRTDAGVHATGQVATLDMERDWQPFRLMEALNHHLRPAPVAILAAVRVADDFHARFSALERRYLFRLIQRRAPLISAPTTIVPAVSNNAPAQPNSARRRILRGCGASRPSADAPRRTWDNPRLFSTRRVPMLRPILLTLLLTGMLGRIFDRDRHFVSLRFGQTAQLGARNERFAGHQIETDLHIDRRGKGGKGDFAVQFLRRGDDDGFD